MQHIIKKQIIKLQIARGLDAFSLQQAVSVHFFKQVLPVIEQVFNEMSGLEETISIDQLEVDLGNISTEEITSDSWNETILYEIREKLKRKLETSAGGQTYVRERNAFSYCRQWLFYMQNGYLPWNTRKVTKEWYDHVLEAFAIDFSSVMALRKLIRENMMAARRIVLQHREDFLVSMVEILTAENQGSLTGAIAELEMILPFDSEMEARSALWEQTMKLSAEKNKLSTEQLIEALLRKHVSDDHGINDLVELHASRLSIILPVLQNLADTSQGMDSDLPSIDIGENGRQNLQHKDLTTPRDIDGEGIHIQYAGLVLVHPFLYSLFKRLELVSEGAFRNISTQRKALCLLHYIATGNTIAEEYEMMIPKILCAWPIDKPVDKQITLSAEEMAEADGMLEALVQHWAVLKNTSIEGLREGFFDRSGKLLDKNGQLVIQVEAKAIDVLLDHLPWILGMIKLPWMKELLRVEWR